MSFLIILIATTSIAWLFRRRSATAREHARRGLALAMMIAGTSHFANSEPFAQHLPDWVPGREPLVHVTGAIEVLFGLALVRFPAARQTVGRLLAIYLVAVLPANVYVAVADVDVTGQAGGLLAWIRLPLQGLFIAWTLWSTTAPLTPAAVAGTHHRAPGQPHRERIARDSPGPASYGLIFKL